MGDQTGTGDLRQILLFLCVICISRWVNELWVVCGLSELKTKCFVSMWVNVSVNVQVRWVALVRTCLPWIYGWLHSCLGMCVCVCVTFIIQHISVWASTGLLQSWIWCDIMRVEGSCSAALTYITQLSSSLRMKMMAIWFP